MLELRLRLGAAASLLLGLGLAIACGDAIEVAEAPSSAADAGPAGVGEGAGAPAARTRAPSARESRATCPGDEQDLPAVFAMLDEERFDALESVYVGLHRAYETEPACEVELIEASEWLAIMENLPLFDAFVAAKPDSWVAHALRGMAHTRAGLVSRGTRFANQVREEQWAGMRAAFALAHEDLARSLELAPANLIAIHASIRIAKQSGDHETVISLLQSTLERDALTYSAREEAMHALRPEWGGSIAAMAAIADEAQAHAKLNPRLAGLPGHIVAVQAHRLRHQGKAAEALAAYRRALTYMPHNGWYRDFCTLAWKQEAYEDVLRVATEWLDLQGPHYLAYTWRGKVYERTGRMDRALADYDRAVEMAPVDPWVLNTRGYFHERAGRLELAMRDYQRVLELRPGYAWTVDRLAEAERALAPPAEKGRLPALEHLGLVADSQEDS